MFGSATWGSTFLNRSNCEEIYKYHHTCGTVSFLKYLKLLVAVSIRMFSACKLLLNNETGLLNEEAVTSDVNKCLGDIQKIRGYLRDGCVFGMFPHNFI